MQIASLSRVLPNQGGKLGGWKSGVEVGQVILYLPCDSQGLFFPTPWPILDVTFSLTQAKAEKFYLLLAGHLKMPLCTL